MRRLFFLTLFSLFGSTLLGQTNTWIGPSGNWNKASNWSLNTVPTINHDVVIPSGVTVTLIDNADSRSLTVEGNSVFRMLGAQPQLTFKQASSFGEETRFEMTCGTLRGGGIMTLNGTTIVSSSLTKKIDGGTTLINNGTFTMKDVGGFYFTNGTLINEGKGVIDLQAIGTGFSMGTPAPGTKQIIRNQGLFKRTTINDLVTVKVDFYNDGGTVHVETGHLLFRTGKKVLTNGLYNVEEEATLTLDGEVHCIGLLTGESKGIIDVFQTFLIVAENTTATLDFNENMGIVFSNLRALKGGGTLKNLGKITMKTSFEKRISENSTLRNEGKIIVDGSGNLEIYDGTLINSSTGEIELRTQANIKKDPYGDNNLFLNEGLLIRTISHSAAEINVKTINSGTFEIQTGAIKIGENTFFSNTMEGIIKGNGTIVLPDDSYFTNEGTFSPGGTPGTLNVTGNFNSAMSSKLLIDIFGYTQASEYDLLYIQGDAVLKGDIEINLNKSLNLGDEFKVAIANNILNCELPATVSQEYNNVIYNFSVSCLPTYLSLKVVDVLAVDDILLNELSLYPNPTNGKFTIDLGKQHRDVSVQIFNAIGQLISTEKYISAKVIEQEIKTSSGLYFLKIKSANQQTKTLKIIKK